MAVAVAAWTITCVAHAAIKPIGTPEEESRAVLLSVNTGCTSGTGRATIPVSSGWRSSAR